MKDIKKGILFILSSAFFFSLMSLFVRMAGNLPSVQKSFFRNVVALVFALIVILKQKSGFHWKKGNLKFLLIRSFFGTIGILCNFYAMDHLVLSDASMLNKMSPFFAIILSFLFLSEKVSLIQAGAVLAAFAGSLFIIKPSFANMDMFPSLIGLLGGFGAGAAYTTVRHLGKRGERGPYIVFFFSAFSCVVTLPLAIASFQPMSNVQIIYLLCAGLAAALAQFSITAAYRYAPAKDISVYDYSQVLFTAVWGFIFFQEIPDTFSIIGYLIICSTAVGMFIYNKKRS